MCRATYRGFESLPLRHYLALKERVKVSDKLFGHRPAQWIIESENPCFISEFTNSSAKIVFELCARIVGKRFRKNFRTRAEAVLGRLVNRPRPPADHWLPLDVRYQSDNLIGHGNNPDRLSAEFPCRACRRRLRRNHQGEVGRNNVCLRPCHRQARAPVRRLGTPVRRCASSASFRKHA